MSWLRQHVEQPKVYRLNCWGLAMLDTLESLQRSFEAHATNKNYFNDFFSVPQHAPPPPKIPQSTLL